MNVKYDWKHLGVAVILTIALCVGILLYNRWDTQRFRESLGEPQIHTSKKDESLENLAEQTSPGTTTLPEASEEVETSKQQKTKPEIVDKEAEGANDASFEDFLGFLDELEDEYLAILLENLNLTDAEKDAFTEILQQQSENTPEVHPSTMVVDMIESGVATLAGLIELMEASVSTMSESEQERFQDVDWIEIKDLSHEILRPEDLDKEGVIILDTDGNITIIE